MRGVHTSLGLSGLISESEVDLRTPRAPAFLATGPASGKVGVQEDVDTHEQDGIEATHTGPESMSLGCLAITWRKWEEERETDEEHRATPYSYAQRSLGWERDSEPGVTHVPALAPTNTSGAKVHQVRFSTCREQSRWRQGWAQTRLGVSDRKWAAGFTRRRVKS